MPLPLRELLKQAEENRRAALPSTVYLTGCTNPPTAAAAKQQPRLGMLAQPGNSIHNQSRFYTHWAIDNGVYGVATQAFDRKRGPWTHKDTLNYLAYLKRVCRETDISNCKFATAPDVLGMVADPVTGKPIPIGDAVATWHRSRPVFPLIRALGLPVALVAQDGISECHPIGAEWGEFDAVMIGGSDEFKLGPEGREIAKLAKQHGKWLHMGRVNSQKRLAYAQSIGCDSVDGTYIGRGPDKNLPKVLGWLAETAVVDAA